MKKAIGMALSLALWLAGTAPAAAQSNAIESVDVTQQGGKTLVRVTTREPLKSVPPNFAVASPIPVPGKSACEWPARLR